MALSHYVVTLHYLKRNLERTPLAYDCFEFASNEDEARRHALKHCPTFVREHLIKTHVSPRGGRRPWGWR